MKHKSQVVSDKPLSMHHRYDLTINIDPIELMNIVTIAYWLDDSMKPCYSCKRAREVTSLHLSFDCYSAPTKTNQTNKFIQSIAPKIFLHVSQC